MIIAALLVLLGTAAPTLTSTASEQAAAAQAPASAAAARAETQPAAPTVATGLPRTRAEVQAEAIDALRTAHEAGRH